MSAKFITPDWPAPDNVQALMTTRDGGVSPPPYDSLNLGAHVGDSVEHVERNREIVSQRLALPNRPKWLNQTHSTTAVSSTDAVCEGDACFTDRDGKVCVVMTADCLPLLVCNRQGTEVAAIHAGWRGLHAGVIESTINRLNSNPAELMVWLGAAIGPQQFEVGEEVRMQFVEKDAATSQAFTPSDSAGHWLADIFQLARVRLKRLGVHGSNIYGGGHCTYSDAQQFFSYRRDGVTGRMAALIWME